MSQLAYLVMVLLAVGRAEAPEGLVRPAPGGEGRLESEPCARSPVPTTRSCRVCGKAALPEA